MPVKRRAGKVRRRDMALSLWAALHDEPLPEDAALLDRIDFHSLMGSGLPSSAMREPWLEHRDAVLDDWVVETPGTRPLCWWQFDAPGPRLCLGGVGQPAHEVLAHGRLLMRGVPVFWVTATDVAIHASLRRPNQQAFTGTPVDPDNPPLFESEATYLRRHGLLLPGEAENVSPGAFAPVIAGIG